MQTALRIEMYLDSQAHSALDDNSFIQEWRDLHAASAHATAYQAPTFARAWYRTYRQPWVPVIVCGLGPRGELLGLWLLAHNTSTSHLAHAGAHQAEYQVWLARREVEDEFVALAWQELKRRLSFDRLSFKYLPSVKCAQTLLRVESTVSAVTVTVQPRPLIRLDPQDIQASFAKKSNKSRFNRLKKLGQLEFRRLRDPAELEHVFDDFCAQYDFRQGAVNHSTPFFDDPLKRAFHAELFAVAEPEECWVSVTLLNGRLIAGLWGLCSGSTVHLGMLVHSPMLAEHSPGKIHIMQLSQALVDGGVAVLDLTPGGDPWKERFANAHDEVAYAVLFRDPAKREATLSRERATNVAKQLAAKVGVTPAKVRTVVGMLKRARPAAALRRIRGWVGVDREFRIYRADRALAQRQQCDARVGRNALAELVAFTPGESWQSRDAFLSSALQRVERGEVAYTVLLEGRLAHCGWMVRGQTESRMTEVEQVMRFPPGSVALYDFYSHPDFRGRGLYRVTVGHMLQEAFTFEDTQFAYISVLADNGPSRHVIESLGFEYQGSFHLHRRFAKARKWADASLKTEEVVHG